MTADVHNLCLLLMKVYVFELQQPFSTTNYRESADALAKQYTIEPKSELCCVTDFCTILREMDAIKSLLRRLHWKASVHGLTTRNCWPPLLLATGEISTCPWCELQRPQVEQVSRRKSVNNTQQY